MLRHDLEQIVSAASAQGILADINSNLLMLTKERAAGLVAAGVREVSASLYGTGTIHDKMTGQKGSFDRVLQGIDLCREAGIAVDVHGAIWNGMLHSVETLIYTVQKHNVSSITFFSLIPTETWENDEEYLLTPGLAQEAIMQMRETFTIPIRTVGLRMPEEEECVMGNGIYGVGTDMRMKPCLLSRHINDSAGIDLRLYSLKEAISLLESQMEYGEWQAACCPQ